jgi:hypothetical protein
LPRALFIIVSWLLCEDKTRKRARYS